MKLSPFLFLAVLCFFIFPVSAIEIAVTDLHYVAHNIPSSSYLGDKDSLILVASDNDIRSFDTMGGTTSVNQVMNFSTDVTGIYCTNNYLYVSLQDGKCYKIKTSDYAREFSALSFEGDNRDAVYLGDLITGTATNFCNPIFADSTGTIYFHNQYENKVTKISGLTYVSTEFISSATLQSILYGDSTYRAGSAIASNSLIIAGGDTGYDLDVFAFTSTNTYTQIYNNIILDSKSGGAYVAKLSNGNYVLGYSVIATPYTTTIIEVNSTSSIGTIYSAATSHASGFDIGNLIVKPNGLVCFASPATDKVYTFGTISGSGGVYTEDEGTTPREITYNVGSINAEYETYYNMSNVNAKWSIAIDDDFINTWVNTHSTPIQDTYTFRIELFSNDDVFVSSYDIPKSSWKYQAYTWGLFGSGDYISSGSVQFSNIRGNGTWKFKLYEINKITGAKAFVDSDTFQILNQNNPTGAGIPPLDNNPTNIVTNFLESPYLIAIIIIGVVGFQFGRGKDGNINGSAMVVLIPLAVGLCALMGILPMWILYTMVLCIIAFIAMKLSTGGS